MARARKNKEQVAFNDKLILFRYFLKQLGKNSLRDFSRELNTTEYEGYDENNNTWFFVYMKRVCKNIPSDLLRKYDENICCHVKHINEKREHKIVLKYYQYISLLFTEMYLDRYFTSRDKFIKDLNSFIDEISAETLGQNSFTHYKSENMNKLAYMCATGSGKTLIMHINILQFLYYRKKAKRYGNRVDINKIIVLTPNEGLSEQHYNELILSSIPSNIFSKGIGNFSYNEDVIVIDINKFKEEGRIKTVSVDSFETNNLVLVDEGHRGMTGEVWKEYRDKLSADGFAFEYSATFKQALKSKKNKEFDVLMDEYGKAIIMDYSYKYFYDDGYGKDYRIYNLNGNVDNENRYTYLIGCLMSFYQQMKLFVKNKTEYAQFQLEKPLLVFVGNRVTASVSAAELTDIEQILSFIDSFVQYKQKSIDAIKNILKGETGLTDNTGSDLFYQDFNGLNSIFNDEFTPENVYNDILRIVFNVDSIPDIPRLHIVNLKQVDGEIALKIGEYGDYFGVISVGDTSSLVKKCDADGLITDTEEFRSESLFMSINDKKSDINVLIGSRKFSEGWNSWRVSTMGLINFAKSEGSQAIQLFGRGVRLRGYNGCLKRSGRIDENIDIPKHIQWLETLTIFGVKAEYMEDFKKFLEMEDVPKNENPKEFELKIFNRYKIVEEKGLMVISLPEDKKFKKQSKRLVLMPPDDDFFSYLVKNKIVIDCRSKIQSIESSSSLNIMPDTYEYTIDSQYIPYLDYQQIYEELQLYKNDKKYYNLSIDKSVLKEIISKRGWYSLIIPKSYVKIDSVDKLYSVSEYAVMILKVYMDKFFKFHKEKWEAPLLDYSPLTVNNRNFEEKYTIRYTPINDIDSNTKSIDEFIATVERTLSENDYIPDYRICMDNELLTAFDFKNHLYAPLIHMKTGSLKLEVMPVSMNDGEMKFVDMLNEFLVSNPDYLSDKEIYLLRNKSKDGIGFFEAGNFYPDFILWIKDSDIQRISFVDPKGLLRLMPDDPKIEFYKTIKELERHLNLKNPDNKIILNSFVMSSTSSENLREWWKMSKPERESKHVFCLDSDNCIEKMLDEILTDKLTSN